MKRLKFILCLSLAMVVGFVSCSKDDDEDESGSGKIKGHEYVDLGLPTGVLWAKCNIGASNPWDFGDYYAWAETSTKDDYSWETLKYEEDDTETKYNESDGKKTLESGDDAAQTKWGGSWRMPTKGEFTDLINNCKWTWTSQGGNYGYVVTGPNGNSIFLPAAGNRYEKKLEDEGSYGYYWSSTVSNDTYRGMILEFESDNYHVYDMSRNNGLPIRPVCTK